MSTDTLWTYNTNNCASHLRGREIIFIRVAAQTQFEKILSMNADKIPSTLNFECRIEYSTLADQRITYMQDSISGIDRSSYSWEKMRQASMRGVMSQYSSLAEQNHTLSVQTDTDNDKK